MNFTYDSIADAINIIFKKGKVAETKKIAPGAYLDVDKEGTPLYLEILDASKKFSKEKLKSFSFEPLGYKLSAK